jgi:hypothetical protein
MMMVIVVVYSPPYDSGPHNKWSYTPTPHVRLHVFFLRLHQQCTPYVITDACKVSASCKVLALCNQQQPCSYCAGILLKNVGSQSCSRTRSSSVGTCETLCYVGPVMRTGVKDHCKFRAVVFNKLQSSENFPGGRIFRQVALYFAGGTSSQMIALYIHSSLFQTQFRT